MTKKLLNAFVIVCAMMLVGCKSDGPKKSADSGITFVKNAEDLYGSWKLSKVPSLKGLTEEEATKEKARYTRKRLLLNFFPDNVLTRIQDQKYTRTSWNFNGLKSSVTVGEVLEGRAEKFDFGFDKMELYKEKGEQILKIENELGIFHLKKTGDVLGDVTVDPFHPKNNQWRVIAAKSESYRQMQERLLNYTEHNLALFKAAKERGADKVYNANSIGIYSYYDGAIKIVDGGKVPSKWMANFYSPEEAMDAWTFANTYFKSGFIRKKHADGFVASGEAIFEDLIEKMKTKIASGK